MRGNAFKGLQKIDAFQPIFHSGMLIYLCQKAIKLGDVLILISQSTIYCIALVSFFDNDIGHFLTK